MGVELVFIFHQISVFLSNLWDHGSRHVAPSSSIW